MAGNYRKKQAARRQGRFLGQTLFAFVFFIAGYLSASLYGLTNLSSWVGAHLFANNSSQMIIKTSTQAAALPKPKFEFYTLLANEKVAGSVPASAPVKVATLTPSATSVSPPPATQAAKSVALPLHAPLSATEMPRVAAAEKNQIPAIASDSYLVQVGSFRSMHEAERMKASLVMKGFDVNIATINQQRVNWYRVIIGPFASRTQAQLAQQSFARQEHIVGMVRKMDA